MSLQVSSSAVAETDPRLWCERDNGGFLTPHTDCVQLGTLLLTALLTTLLTTLLHTARADCIDR